MASNLIVRTATVALVSLGVAAPLLARQAPAPGPDTQTTPVSRQATIAARDQVTIKTLNEPMFSGQFLVDIDGTIDYPYLGRLKVAGLSARDVEQEIRKDLQAKQYVNNPQVVVELEQATNKQFSIIGSGVHAPGIYRFSGSAITLLDALAQAGSVTDDASDDLVVVRAATGTTEHVDLPSLLSGGPGATVLVENGDNLIVNRADPVYVMGPVRNPSAYVVKRGTTVQQLLAMAGGVTEKGKTSGIKIQRPSGPDRKPKEIEVKDYKTEVVKPGDTVIVPTRIW